MLIVDMNVRGDSLAKDEFVAPIGSAVGEHEVRHYLERVDPSRYNRVILYGTPLMDSGSARTAGRCLAYAPACRHWRRFTARSWSIGRRWG